MCFDGKCGNGVVGKFYDVIVGILCIDLIDDV